MNFDNIGPATRIVPLGSGAAEVSGLSLRKCFELLGAYPYVASFVSGGQIDVARMLFEGPEIALAIFALSEPRPARRRFWQRAVPGGGDIISVFDTAAAGQQLGALASIVDLTFKGGERALPFLQSLLAAPPPEAVPETPSESLAEPSSTSSP